MTDKALSDRLYASLPGDDPRFTEMREVLAAVIQRGKGSPAARMLGEWALLGYLLSTGKLGIGEGTYAPMLPTTLPDPQEVLAVKQQVEAAAHAWDFD
jgi:hypothetical protein